MSRAGFRMAQEGKAADGQSTVPVFPLAPGTPRLKPLFPVRHWSLVAALLTPDFWLLRLNKRPRQKNATVSARLFFPLARRI